MKPEETAQTEQRVKRPAFQFYPAEWLKDLELQGCSIGARGLWIQLCCVMHEATPYGHLVLNALPMPDEKAARACRVDLREYRRLLAELELSGVSSRDASGALYSRRMTRDEATRNARAAGGTTGGEFGVLGKEHGKKGGRPKKQTGDQKPPLKPPPSSSSSSSSSENQGVATQPVELVLDAPGDRKSINGHDKAKVERAGKLQAEARGVLEFLNERAGKKFPPSDSNIGIIVARFRESFTPAQARQVIAMKVRKWLGDEKMAEYLRPLTLFNRKNFSNYVGELVDVPDSQE